MMWSDDSGGVDESNPRNAEFLRGCFPDGSAFAVAAYTGTGSQEGDVTWFAAVVSPHALDLSGWKRSWEQVRGLIEIGTCHEKRLVHVVEPGGELEALDDREHWLWSLKCSTHCVKTGSFGALKEALVLPDDVPRDGELET
jgi:hypothetical protein